MSDKKTGKEKSLFKQLLSKVKRFFQSFSFIIFIYLIIFTIAPVTILNLLDNYYFGNIIRDTELAGMQTQAAVLTDDVRHYGGLDEAVSAGVYKNFSYFASVNEIRIRVVDNDFRILHDTYGFDNGKTIINESVVRVAEGSGGVSRFVNNDMLIESAVPLLNNNGDVQGTLLLSKNVSKLDTSLRNAHNYSTLITVATVIVMAIFAAFLAKKFH